MKPPEVISELQFQLERTLVAASESKRRDSIRNQLFRGFDDDVGMRGFEVSSLLMRLRCQRMAQFRGFDWLRPDESLQAPYDWNGGRR